MPQCGEGGRMENLIPYELVQQYLKEDSYATTKDKHENAIDAVYEWCYLFRGREWVAENFRFIETELKIARESVAQLLEAHNG